MRATPKKESESNPMSIMMIPQTMKTALTLITVLPIFTTLSSIILTIGQDSAGGILSGIGDFIAIIIGTTEITGALISSILPDTELDMAVP